MLDLVVFLVCCFGFVDVFLGKKIGSGVDCSLGRVWFVSGLAATDERSDWKYKLDFLFLYIFES